MTLARDALRRTTRWDGREIRYAIAFGARQRLTISVHPDLRVHVDAPAGRSVDEVAARVEARRAWIARQLRDLAQFHPLPAPHRWVDGESHWYLGRQYRLRVERGEPAAWRAAGWLHVRSPSRKADAVAAVAREWYLERARELLYERVDAVRASHVRLTRLQPKLRVLAMSRRWGSCSALGTISLNVELVKARVAQVDYVIAHELCHMVVPAHSDRFYRLLTTCMPDWQRRRKALNATVR